MVAFPANLSPANISLRLENVSRSGGASTNGQEQIVSSGVSRWVATLADCPIRNNREILALRAFVAAMNGRAGRTLVPAFDLIKNWPVDAFGRLLLPENTRRERLDGTIYADPAIPAQSHISAFFASPAARRATTVQISQSGVPAEPGQYFSPSPGRLHILTEYISNGIYRIEPPLRDPVAAGQAVDFMTPSCEMRFVDDSQGDIELQYGRWGFVTLQLVEAF